MLTPKFCSIYTQFFSLFFYVVNDKSIRH